MMYILSTVIISVIGDNEVWDLFMSGTKYFIFTNRQDNLVFIHEISEDISKTFGDNYTSSYEHINTLADNKRNFVTYSRNYKFDTISSTLINISHEYVFEKLLHEI